MRRFAVASLLVLAIAGDASANGRPSATSTIHFRQGHEQDIVAGMTFGVLVSHDNGATWHWMCEANVGYAGLYDPDYAYTSSGAIFATTFDGLKVQRPTGAGGDSCTFASTPPGTTFITQDELGPTGAFYYAAGDPADGKIYKSTDDGMTFPTSAAPGMNNDWWESLVVAPSDATRVYLSGYRLNGGTKTFLLFRSTNSGSTFTAMSQTGFTLTMNSAIDIVGVAPNNPDIVYAKVTLENGTNSDGLYKSINGGGSWTKIATTLETMSFLARKNGDIMYASPTMGAKKSANGGTTWTDLTTAPHINCLAENSAGEVWACTANFTSPGQPNADGFGIMKSTDLTTWTGVLKFQEIKGPVSCAAGTVQEDQCVQPYKGMPSVWCCLAQQLGITSSEVSCTGALACNPVSPDGGPPGGDDFPITPGPKGCCDTGNGASTLAGGLLVALLLLRKRKAC
jgi:hypothetical protein